jgi:hypothetical protein
MKYMKPKEAAALIGLKDRRNRRKAMTTKAEQSTMESNRDQFVKQFAEETGVSPVTATLIWHLKQAYRLLHEDECWQSYRDFTVRESREIDRAFKQFASDLPPLEGTRAEEWDRLFKEVLSREEGANSKEVGE